MKKRIFSLALAVSMMFNLFTFVSARTIYVNQNIVKDKTVELYYMDGANLVLYNGYEGYEASKINDGNMDTFCYNKAFNPNKSGYSNGHLAIIDLGDYYDITKIVVTPENTKNAANELGFTTENGYSSVSTPNGAGRVVVSQNKPIASQFTGNTFTTSGDTNGVMLTNTAQSSNFNATRTFNESDATKYRYVSVWAGWSHGFAIKEVEVYGNAPKEVPDELYVSPKGDDANDGSQERPFKTIKRAKEMVREIKKDMDRDIVVHIAGGKYELSETLDFDEEDSGTNGYNIVYQGDPNNMPTISAGTELNLSWTEGEDGIWSAQVNDNRIEYIRNLYVNETPATRASSSKLVYGLENYVANGSSYMSDGFYVNKADIGVFANQEDIQLRWTVGWKSWMFYIDEIVNDPSNSDRVIVKMNNPLWSRESVLNSTNAWPGQPSYQYGFRVENAYELLDEPGEFYFNRNTRTLSYLPREGENMSTASVICPVLDKVLSVTGEPNAEKLNSFKYVNNLEFKNLRFAHSNFSALEESDMIAYQCEILHMTNVPKGITPGAVEVGFADNIAIEDCVFFGMSSAALELTDKVTNSNFARNVFTDIGFGAFVVGHNYHNVADNAPWGGQWGNSIGVVSYRKGWTTSNQKSMAFSESINSNIADPESLVVHGIWRSEQDAAQTGAKPWVKMDLGKEYNIDSVFLSFSDYATQTTTEEERRNFEILVSNDEDFNEYETLVVQTEPVNSSETTKYQNTTLKNSKLYSSSLEGKYRYVMVRKTVAERLALSLMRVYSFDEKPLGKFGLNINNTFQNNYISRIGVINNASPAITAFDTDGLKILHNEIEDVPYSGISIGYGWSNKYSATAGNNEIKYNKISDVEKIASDGGAIYTLSNQSAYVNGVYDTENKKPLEVTNNYIVDQGNIIAGLYSDSGSSYMNFTDNVMQNAALMFFASGGSSKDPEGSISKNLTYDNLYADDLDCRNENQNYNTVGEMTRFSAEQMPVAAKAIALNAGLEASAEYIKNRVPSNKSPFIVGPDAYASYLAKGETPVYGPDKTLFIMHTAETMLEIGEFGNLPWQYDAKYKPELQYWLDRSHEDTNRVDDVLVDGVSRNGFTITKSHMYEFVQLEKAYREATASVTHLSYEDMLSMCKEKSGTLTTDEYSSSSINAFNRAIAAAEGADHSTEAIAYEAVLAMEDAYEELENGKKSADLLYAYAEDGDVEIDYENKTAVITVPANVDTTAVRPVFTAMPNSYVSGNYSSTDFSNGATVTLRKGSTTTNWTVTVVNKKIVPSEMITVENNADKWYSENPNSPVTVVGDGVRIQNWNTPTMYKDAFGRRLNFSVKAGAVDNINGINLIFGAKTCEDLEPEGYYKKNTYYMLTLKGQTLTLYSVDSGVKTEVAKAENIGFDYNGYNDFEIRSVSGNTVNISVNGASKISKAVSGGTEGYFGVYSKASRVDVKPYGFQLTASISGNTLTVNANLKLDKEKTYPIVIGGYAEDESMTDVIYSKIGFVDGQWKIENTYDISGFSDDAKIIRVHLFDSAENVMPLCKRAEISR